MAAPQRGRRGMHAVPEVTGASGSPRRRRDVEPLAWWTLFAVLVGIGVYTQNWRLLLVALLVWSFYEIALVPTVCGISTRSGQFCAEPVRGRAFGHDPRHQKVKNDGLWALIGMNNPFHKAQGDGSPRDTGTHVAGTRRRTELVVKDRALLTLAGIGTIVALGGMLWGLFP
ncbi:hypothetical protein [Actinocorallia longicatena]|uniref:Uncharacterized protein n=1 Tax=Actinocorallia longicatena TaxID=111803 RepID=A0ABP6QFZ9_9ACTN